MATATMRSEWLAAPAVQAYSTAAQCGAPLTRLQVRGEMSVVRLDSLVDSDVQVGGGG